MKKHIYIDSRLTPLLLDADVFNRPRQRIFSQGRPWLLLTPERFRRVAELAGVYDGRIGLLVRVIRRHAAEPACFCQRIGVETAAHHRPDTFPPVLCPRCDGVHAPHPEDTARICESCRGALDRARSASYAGGKIRDKRMDVLARERLRELEPAIFNDGDLSPQFFRINLRRTVSRDWDAAVNQILHGRSYKQVAAAYDCSVGLLHGKVKERYWENN